MSIARSLGLLQLPKGIEVAVHLDGVLQLFHAGIVTSLVASAKHCHSATKPVTFSAQLDSQDREIIMAYAQLTERFTTPTAIVKLPDFLKAYDPKLRM